MGIVWDSVKVMVLGLGTVFVALIGLVFIVKACIGLPIVRCNRKMRLNLIRLLNLLKKLARLKMRFNSRSAMKRTMS